MRVADDTKLRSGVSIAAREVEGTHFFGVLLQIFCRFFPFCFDGFSPFKNTPSGKPVGYRAQHQTGRIVELPITVDLTARRLKKTRISSTVASGTIARVPCQIRRSAPSSRLAS